ncbi:MAG: hypothetical protein DHS20C15_07240 [Planctomycetota bacterium]|nr:MAG: hypothetical protein DHS20C15_07240 [Planctomycetota bacterium]
MSSIGKIFVVVNLVLALLVVGAAGALLQTESEAASKLDALQAELTQTKADLDDLSNTSSTARLQLENQKNQLQADKDDAEVARENADRSAKRLEVDNQALQGNLEQLAATFELLQRDLSEAQKRNRDLADNNDSLRTAAADSKEAQRNAELARRDAEDAADAIRGQIDSLNDELTAALDGKREAERVVEIAQASGFDLASIVATPLIEAVVADVDEDYNFVILDKGLADGVKKGFTLDIYRLGGTDGENWLGQVRVDDVHENHSVASVIVADGSIRRFDRATTRL